MKLGTLDVPAIRVGAANAASVMFNGVEQLRTPQILQGNATSTWPDGATSSIKTVTNGLFPSLYSKRWASNVDGNVCYFDEYGNLTNGVYGTASVVPAIGFWGNGFVVQDNKIISTAYYDDWSGDFDPNINYTLGEGEIVYNPNTGSFSGRSSVWDASVSEEIFIMTTVNGELFYQVYLTESVGGPVYAIDA